MATSSNIYAEKIFAEHPLAIWLLDDTADYVSLISDDQRNIAEYESTPGNLFWTKNANVSSLTTEEVSLVDSPFTLSPTTKIVIDKPVSGTHIGEIRSGVLGDLADLRIELATFAFSSYIYSSVSSEYLESVYLGYSYENSPGVWTDVEQEYTGLPTQVWTLFSKTFDLIDYKPFKIFIKFKVNSLYSGSDYTFYVNGITVGQWSEEFNAISLGVNGTSMPSDIALPASTVTPAYAYGLQDNTGYYFIKDNFLTAQNTSIPMVFGAENITSLTENKDELDIPLPSLIVPGKGFLNKVGQYQEYTVEFWARINCDSPDPLRIFGPIASNDGIYVEDGFITLSINGISQSYFVGEWYRPMLIHIRLTRDSANLLINGEEVIQLRIVTDDLILPEEFITVSSVEKSQDWLGFYAYENVYPFEIDCISIYSYQIPEIVAKRRYAYGQAVGSPQNINTAFGGTTAFIDYSFANYSVNYNYPDFAKWEQAAIENLTATRRTLETPDYSLPTIYLGNVTSQSEYEDRLDEFYRNNDDLQTEDNLFIKLTPENEDVDWSTYGPYINFPKFNFLNNPVAGFYGVFKIDEAHSGDDSDDQILFKLRNKNTGDSLVIKKDKHEIVEGGPLKDVIAFYLNFGGQEQNDFILKEYDVDSEKLIAVGIDINSFISYYGGNIASFFGNINGLELFVGGDETGQETFTGNIYDIGFCTSRNLSELSDHFDNDGITFTNLESGDTGAELLEHFASYTLLIQNNYGVYGLDVGISGYWQDYLPLSYFAKFVQDSNGNEYYDLDFLQFNIGYPANSLVQSETILSGWTYSEILASDNYSNYDQLLVYTLSQSPALNYRTFSENQQTTFSFNTDNSSVKSYVTFQYISDGANLIPSSFTQLTSANQSRIIDINDYPDWEQRKFEIVDNNIIYPRKDVDFNDIAIVMSLEFNVRGIINKKIAINNLQVASLALSNNAFNPIGTKFGQNLYPYRKIDLYYTYKDKNPFSIYKGSTPYLYLTRDSGIEIRGEILDNESRGVLMPINESQASNFFVNAFQLWMRSDIDLFPEKATQLFEIDSKEKIIRFYIEPTDFTRKRARIFAIALSKFDNLETEFLQLSYYVNGNPVLVPTITIKQWTSLGFSLSQSLDMSLYSGSINLIGPLVFNNVSYFKTNNLSNIETVVTRQWSAVLGPLGDRNDWEYWLDLIDEDGSSFSWRDVYGTFSSIELGLNPSDIYAAYTGTNKLIVDDGFGLRLKYDKLVNHNAISWTRRYDIPV